MRDAERKKAEERAAQTDNLVPTLQGGPPPVAASPGLHKAWLAALREIGAVHKDKVNQFHGYAYTSEVAIVEAVRPALLKHGLILVPSMEGVPQMDAHGNTQVIMGYTLISPDTGETAGPFRFPGQGNDRAKNGAVGDKGAPKALTGASKYALTGLFMIARSDDPEKDSDNDSVGDRADSGSTATVQPVGNVDNKISSQKEGPSPNSDVPRPDAPVPDAQGRAADVIRAALGFVDLCKDKVELEKYWISNSELFDGLKKNNKLLYRELLDAFKKRKQEIAQ